MPLLDPLDVVWVDDGLIKPPGPKMVVCIEPSLGLYFRINTDSKWQTPIKLFKKDNPFLKWDSHLECGEPIDLDDYCIDESLRLNNERPIGKLATKHVADIIPVVARATTISPDDKEMIYASLLSMLSDDEASKITVPRGGATAP